MSAIYPITPMVPMVPMAPMAPMVPMAPLADPAPPDSTAAKVRFRLKEDPPGTGPVYQGQEITIPCLNCGRK